jgi:signal transduction histidine kinase
MSQHETTVVYPVAGKYDEGGNLKYDTVVPAVPVQQPIQPVQQVVQPVVPVEQDSALREQELERERLRGQDLERERLAREEAERERLAREEAERKPVDLKHDSIAERLVKKVTGKA